MKTSKIMSRARNIANHGKAVVRSTDVGPFVIGHLVVEKRAVDAETGTKSEWSTVVDDKNLVVLNAQNLTAAAMAGEANSAFNYIELGNPVAPTPPNLADVALQQSTGQRKAVTNTRSANVTTAEVLFLTTDGNGFTYTEAGLFTGPFAGGGLYARKIFAGVTKTVAFELRLRWSITYLVQSTGGDCTGIGFVGPGTFSNITYAIAAGLEVSVGATFDFSVGANNLDVFLNGARQVPGVHYNEASPVLTAPCLGSSANKGINFVGIVLNPGDKVFLCQRSIA